MKLLTFVGVGTRFETQYNWNEKTLHTAHFAEALCEWLAPEEVIVFLTTKAKEHENWYQLQAFLNARKVKYRDISIPNGANEKEYWQIFSAMTDSFFEGDQIVIDVTHGFRSLPLLGLMAAAYLKMVRQIDIQHLLYGAYEAKSPEGVAPVFDLTPFLSLLEWMQAANQFTQTGLSRELGQLLTAQQDLLRKNANQGQDLPRRLKGMGENLEHVSQALMLNNPFSLAKACRQMLNRHLPEIQPEVEKWAPPFAAILEKIGENYLPFTHDDLSTQRDLIQWYLERGHWLQAATLAGEWLISYACFHWENDNNPERRIREQVSCALQGYSKARQKSGQIPDFAREVCSLYALDELPEPNLLLNLIDSIPRLRNDLAHCGMGRENNPDKTALKSMVLQLETYVAKLKTLVLP